MHAINKLKGEKHYDATNQVKKKAKKSTLKHLLSKEIKNKKRTENIFDFIDILKSREQKTKQNKTKQNKKKSAQPKSQWRENKSVGNSTKRKYKTDLKTAMTNTERIFIQINSLQWSKRRVGGQARDQAVNIDDLVATKAA